MIGGITNWTQLAPASIGTDGVGTAGNDAGPMSVLYGQAIPGAGAMSFAGVITSTDSSNPVWTNADMQDYRAQGAAPSTPSMTCARSIFDEALPTAVIASPEALMAGAMWI